MTNNIYSSVASKSIIIYLFVAPLALSFLISLWAFINPSWFLLESFIIFWLGFGVVFWIFKNAFVRFTMNEQGIRTKHLSMEWEQVNNIRIIDINLAKYAWPLSKRIQFAPILCIGEINDGGFIFQNRKKCIFVAMTQKNLRMIKHFALGKSNIIDEL